jgi:DNA-binding NtrC family response regulator
MEHPELLIVAPSPALAENLISWVVPEGYRPSVATTFQSANRHLRTHPQVLITQVRLHEYNGLHLALNARKAGIPAVVVGDADSVLARDAEQVGATFISRDELDREQILTLLQNLVPDNPHRRDGDDAPAPPAVI